MPKSVNRLCLRAVEFRATEAMQEGDGRTLEGYAAVFGVPTEINSFEGSFNETIAKGAFRKTLGERTPIMQFDHGHDARTGTIPIGSFQELREDDEGLYVQARLFDNPVVEPVRQAIEGGAITGMSFRFQVMRDEWRDGQDKLVKPNELGELLYNPGVRGPLQRTIKEVQLFEAGPVVFPAYEATSVGVRSALAELNAEDRQRLVSELARGYTAEQVQEFVETHASPGPTGDAVGDPQDPEDVDIEELDAGTTYSVVEDHGCGAGKWAVVESDDNTNESCHPDQASAEQHVKDLKSGKAPTDPEDMPKMPAKGMKDSKPPSETNDGPPAPTTTVTPESSKRKESNMPIENMTVEERVARQEEIRTRLSEIDTDYNGATLPNEIQQEWDDLNVEHDLHDEAIESATARAEQMRRLAVDKPRSSERAGARGGSVGRRRPDNIYDLNEVRNNARSADEVAVLYRENAMRAVEQAKFADTVTKERAQANVERLLNNNDDNNGTLARRILVTGSPTYERAWGKAVRSLSMNGLTSEESRALSLGSDSDGGFAVPFQLDPTVILTSDSVINPLRGVARQVQITGKVWEGVTTSGVVVTRSAEASEVPDNSFQLDQPTVSTTRVTGFVPFSVELESSWGAMRSEITTLLADAKDIEEASSFVNGDGQGNNPFGLVKTLNVSSHVPDMGSFGTEDIYALEEAVPPRFRARSQFLASKGTYNAIRQFGNGLDGADLWVRLGDGRPNVLIGYPALESSEVGAVGAAGGYLLFGDYQHFIIVDRIGMTIELVPHLFGTQGRPTGQRGVLALWANGSKVLVDNAFRLLTSGTS